MKICLLALLMLLTVGATSQTNLKDISADDLLKDIFKFENRGDSLKMVIWFPTEFWYLSNKDTPDFDSLSVSILEDLTRDYIIIAAIDGVLSVQGGYYKNEKELRKNVQLIDQNNKTYLPLSEMQVPKALTSIINSTKPSLETMMDKMGAGMQFYYFKVQDTNDKNLISATQKGRFTI